MKILSFFVFAAVAACSVAPLSQSETTETIEIPLSPPPKVTWKNPVYTGCPNAGHEKAHPHMKFVPDGLTAFTGDESAVSSFDGKAIAPVTLPQPEVKIDTSKKTVVFVIGYDISGQTFDFPNIKAWQKEYNTFVYRWHCEYFAPKLSLGRAMDSLAVAVKNFGNDFDRYDKLVTRWYDKEIRFVSISLGGPLAAEVAHAKFRGRSLLGHSRNQVDGKARFERRLDFLDPAFIMDFMTPESVIDEDGLYHAGFEFNHYAKQILNLSSEGVAVTGFTTAYARFFTSGLYRWMNVQRHTVDWLNVAIEKMLGRKPKLSDQIHYQHVGIVPAYFESIDPSVHPTVVNNSMFANGITAATPTELLRSNKIYLKQLESDPGRETLTLGDDSFEAIDPCPRGISYNFDKSTGHPIINSAYWSLFKTCL